MTPSPIDSASLPDALRQLKALLDQGIITSAEYAILKHRLLTTAETPAANGTATAPPKATAAAPVAPAAAPPPAPAPPPPPPPPVQELPSLLDMFQQAPGNLAAAPAPAPVPMRPVVATAEPSIPRPAPVAAAPVSPPAPVPAAPATRPVVEFLPSPLAAAPAPAVPMSAPAPSDFLPPVAPPTPPVSPNPSVALPPIDVPARPAEPVSARPALPDSLARVEAMLAESAPASARRPAPVPAARRTLPTVLAVLVGLALLLELGYLVLGRSRANEHLTSRSKTAADSVAVRPETGPQAEQPALPPATEPEVVRPAPVVVPVRKPNADSIAAAARAARRKAAAAEDAPVFPSTAPVTTTTTATAPISPATPAAVPVPDPVLVLPGPTEPTGPASAAEDGDDAATTRARQALASYYADLQTPPFNASQHFAPVVERLYTRQNLTPAAIEAELNQSMFPEFKELNTRIVPGTLRVSPPATDGTRTATYTEQSRAFRVSKGQHQRTRTQVRVRFDPDFKMTYMRQEKLLENTFEQ